MFGKTRDLERKIEDIRRLHEDLKNELKGNLTVFHERYIELNNRADEQIARLERILDEVEHRIERGNKIWRQIRAQQSRDAQREEDEGGGEFQGGDASGGEEQGVLTLHQDVDDATPNHLRIAREIARSIAFGG